MKLKPWATELGGWGRKGYSRWNLKAEGELQWTEVGRL